MSRCPNSLTLQQTLVKAEGTQPITGIALYLVVVGCIRLYECSVPPVSLPDTVLKGNEDAEISSKQIASFPVSLCSFSWPLFPTKGGTRVLPPPFS